MAFIWAQNNNAFLKLSRPKVSLNYVTINLPLKINYSFFPNLNLIAMYTIKRHFCFQYVLKAYFVSKIFPSLLTLRKYCNSGPWYKTICLAMFHK